MSADLGNGDPRPLSERCSRKHQPSSWAVWYVVTSAILVSLQTCPLERFMVEQAPPPQIMKREMHGGAIPLGPKQASKIKGIPFLKCLLLLRERFFLAFRATKPGSRCCMQKESNSFLPSGIWKWFLLKILGGFSIYGKIKKELQHAWFSSMVCWQPSCKVSRGLDSHPYRAGSLPQIYLVLALRVPWERHPHPWGSARVPGEDGTPRVKCESQWWAWPRKWVNHSPSPLSGPH